MHRSAPCCPLVVWIVFFGWWLSARAEVETARAAGMDADSFEPFYFVQASDPHLGYAGVAERLRTVFEQANQFQASLVAVTGDLANDANDVQWNQFFNCRAGLAVPVKALPGNHDVVNTATLAAYRRLFGDDYYSFTYNNCAFVCLDSVTLRDPATYPAENQAQWDWLERTMAEIRTARRDRVFILSHHPPYLNAETEPASYNNYAFPERARLLSLARTYGIDAFLCGHLHYTTQSPGVPPIYYVGGTGYVFDGLGYGYRIYKVSKNKMTQFFVRIDQADPYAPNPPGPLTLAARTPSAVTLEWAQPYDNVGVLRYSVRRDGVFLGYAVDERFTDPSPTPGQNYRYTVEAIDPAGNVSAPSPELEASAGPAGTMTLTPAGGLWRYWDGSATPAAGWNRPGFDDGWWPAGQAQFGYGHPDVVTTVTYRVSKPLGSAQSGPAYLVKPITSYYRHTFEVEAPAAVAAPTLRLLCDDGAVVYLNGVEAGRWNVPAGPVTPATPALSEVQGADELAWHELPFNRTLLTTGTNTLAVEVHQATLDNADLRFDLELAASTVLKATTLARGPYLQNGSATAVTVRWRTADPAIGRVSCGPRPESPQWQVTDLAPATEHEMRLNGLKANTKYQYWIEDGARVLAGADGGCAFTTPPPPGTGKPTRIWVIGDSGTGSEGPGPAANARAVLNAFTQYTGARTPDLWLMMGDNARPSGTDDQHQAAVFEMYPALLRNVALWSTLGNHDAYSVVPGTAIHPYYPIFSFPTQGESGGVASGSEAYYAFDYGDIHLICLDSMESDRSPGGPMLSWLKADLAANRARWTLVFFHHPPYSKGAHDSDLTADEGYKQIEMRENAGPILEAGGVDLVLSGHSHSYERSFLLAGHYGASTTLTPAMILNHGDGDEGGDGPYVKPAIRRPRAGTVYATVGSSGLLAGGALNHPAMACSLLVLGSLVLDVNERRLDGHFIDTSGAVRDQFTLWKGTPWPTAAGQWRLYH